MLRYSIRWNADRLPAPGIPAAVMASALLASLMLHVGAFIAILRLATPPARAIPEQVITVTLIPSQPAVVPTSLPTAPEPPPQPAHRSPAPPSERGTVMQGPDTHHPNDRIRSADAVAQRESKSRVANPARNPGLSSHIEVGSQLAMSTNQNLDNTARAAASSYLELLARRLTAVKRYPVSAIALREEGVVMLSFRLDSTGRLLSWHIAATSGHSDLDDEVGRMVAAAAPFPPFPPGWDTTSEAFVVPVTFALW